MMRLDDLPEELNVSAAAVLKAASEVRRELGAGLLESVYKQALAMLLAERGHAVEREVPVRASFRGVPLDVGFRLDMRVDARLVVEAKAVQELAPIHLAQTLTYMRLSGARLGLLINFHAVPFRSGIHRLVTPLRESV